MSVCLSVCLSADSYHDKHKTPRNITKFTCDLANMNSGHGCYSAMVHVMDIVKFLIHNLCSLSMT